MKQILVFNDNRCKNAKSFVLYETNKILDSVYSIWNFRHLKGPRSSPTGTAKFVSLGRSSTFDYDPNFKGQVQGWKDR